MDTKDWWEKKIKDSYFKKFKFEFSRPDLIQKFNLKDKHILEIGFGYGRELSQFCKLSDNVYGIEISPEAIKLATKKLTELGISNMPKFGVYDGINTSHNDLMFNFIYSCFVMQHMSKENAINLIKNSINRLSKDGKILFEFFGHPNYIAGIGDDIFSGSSETGMYNNAYTIEEIERAVEKADGKIEWIEDWNVAEEGLKFKNYWVCICKN